MLFLLLFQAAAASPQALPDIELNAHVRARSVTIEKQGEATLTVRTEPEGANLVDVQAPKANGRKTLRNVDVTVRAEARIGEPGQASQKDAERPETAPPR